MKKILKNKKKILAIVLPVFFLVIIFLLFPEASQASVKTGVAKVLGWIMFPFIALFGKLAVIFLNLLVKVASYSDFIHSPAVTNGWVVVRDLCNMFFVLILLVIAFASILRIESYNLKTWLPKLVIMAILINFSKLICGIFIDFTQVIMLTFVNAFKDMAGGNLTEMLGITDILRFSKKEDGVEQTFEGIIGSVILALVFVIIACVVILTMLIMLVMRIVMIWIYVVLSPLAYLLASFPQGQQYSQRWWSDFSKNLIIGPVLAFFIWLSFASMGSGNSAESIKGMTPDKTDEQIQVAGSQAGVPENIIKYIISIGMLLGGMMIAQEMGGQAGKVVGKGMGKLQAMGTGALKMGKRVTGVERAENAYKSYKQQKESKRQELAQRDAGALLKAEGRVKEAVIAKPSQKIGNIMSKPFRAIAGVSEKKIKQKEEGIKNEELAKEGLRGQGEQLKTQLSGLEKDKETLFKVEGDLTMIPALESERNTKSADFDQQIANAQNTGDFALAGRLRTEKMDMENDYDQRIQEKENEIISDFNTSTGQNVTSVADVSTNLPQAKTSKDSDIVTKKAEVDSNSQDIDSKTKEIELGHKDLSDSRKKVEKVNKWSAVVAGGAFGAFLGGPLGVAAGVAGGAYGAVAGGAVRNSLINSGSDSLDLASNYNGSQISKEKDKLKGLREEELRTVKDDYSQSSHSRTAASMLLMERKELSQEEAKVEKDKIVDSYGYDGRVLDQLDASLASNYQQLSRLFTDLHSTAAPKSGPDNRSDEVKEKHEKAKEKIARNIIDQKISISSIDSQDSLDLIMPKLSEDMTDGNFINMYDRQTNEKQDQVELALERSGTFKADNKLSIINKSVRPIKDAELDKYFKKAKFFQFQDLSNSVGGLEGLKDALSRHGKLNELRTATSLDDFRRKMNKITEKCQFDESPQQRGVLKKIWEKVNS
jgi:hypothetical protein